MVGKLTPDNMLSASRIPALMGLSPYTTPNELLAEIRASDAGERLSSFNGNEATGWGDRLEAAILDEAAKRLSLRNHETNIDKPYFHPDLQLAASLDGMGVGNGTIKTDHAAGIFCMNAEEIDVTSIGVMEAKLTSARPEEQPPAHRGPWQVQAQMMCSGFKWGCVATLYQGIEMRIFVYQADEHIQRRIAEAVEDFELRRVSGDKYPVLSSDDGNFAYREVDDTAPPIDLMKTQGGSRMVIDLAEAKDRKRQAEFDIDQIEANIKELMGESAEATAHIGTRKYIIKWPMRKTRAQPEKIIPAKPESVMRQKTLTLKIIDEE